VERIAAVLLQRLEMLPARDAEVLGEHVMLDVDPKLPSRQLDARTWAFARLSGSAPLVVVRAAVARLPEHLLRFLMAHETAHLVLAARREPNGEPEAEALAAEWGEPVTPDVLADWRSFSHLLAQGGAVNAELDRR